MRVHIGSIPTKTLAGYRELLLLDTKEIVYKILKYLAHADFISDKILKAVLPVPLIREQSKEAQLANMKQEAIKCVVPM